jgi:hypothetical protein
MSGILSEGQKWPVVRAVNPATFMCRLFESPQGLSRPVQGKLYLYLHYKFQFPKHAFSDCDTVKSGTWTHTDGMHALSSALGLSDWLTSSSACGVTTAVTSCIYLYCLSVTPACDISTVEDEKKGFGLIRKHQLCCSSVDSPIVQSGRLEM